MKGLLFGGFGVRSERTNFKTVVMVALLALAIQRCNCASFSVLAGLQGTLFLGYAYVLLFAVSIGL